MLTLEQLEGLTPPQHWSNRDQMMFILLVRIGTEICRRLERLERTIAANDVVLSTEHLPRKGGRKKANEAHASHVEDGAQR